MSELTSKDDDLNHKRILTIKKKNNAYNITNVLIHINHDVIRFYDISFDAMKEIETITVTEKRNNHKLDNLNKKIVELLNNNVQIQVYVLIFPYNDINTNEYLFFQKIWSLIKTMQIKLTINCDEIYNKINSIEYIIFYFGDFSYLNNDSIINIIEFNDNIIDFLAHKCMLNINKIIYKDEDSYTRQLNDDIFAKNIYDGAENNISLCKKFIKIKNLFTTLLS